MRTKFLYALLFLAIVFAGASLWWAFMPAPTEDEVASTRTSATPRRQLRSPTPSAENVGFLSAVETEEASDLLPESTPDAEGLVRRVVLCEEEDEEALRRTVLALGGQILSWQSEGGYEVAVTPEVAERLANTASLRVRAASVPISEDLRDAVDALQPGERLRVTLVCTTTAARDATAHEAAILGRVELLADTSVIAHLSAGALREVLKRTGAGILVADLQRDITLMEVPDFTALSTLDVPADNVFSGRGEAVAIMDTGCSGGLAGLGTDEFHPDLESSILAILPQPWWAFRQSLKATDGLDVYGHGTHVAGIIAGTGKSSLGRRFRGVAPETRLLIQNNAFGGKGGLAVPPDLRSVFAEAYAQGVRIHSDSWGNARIQSAAYDLGAWAADRFVWDHPDFLILFAAGNNGPDEGTLAGGAALGKNVLTIGALNSDGTGAADFSSRGPTADGRLKPELLAPGTDIVATGPLPENGYRVASGTSMATPYVAGVAAAWRQWLRETYELTAPSAALMRALLLLGSLPVGTEESPAEALIPSSVLAATEGRLGFASFTYGATGAVSELALTQRVGGGPFTAVLAWTDAPADIRAAQTLVNRLSLALLDASGSSVAGELTRYGTAIRLSVPALPAGDYVLTVTSDRVPMPGGSGAIAYRSYAPNAIHFLHAPLQRVTPGTSEALTFVTTGFDEEELILETAMENEPWEDAPQNRRLDVPSETGTLWYRWLLDDLVFGPYAVAIGDPVTLTVKDDGTDFVTAPLRGEHVRCEGETITARAYDAWRWEVSHAGTPTITRTILPVAGWRLTETSSGKTLAQGEGAEATFTMPKRPVTLTWRRAE